METITLEVGTSKLSVVDLWSDIDEITIFDLLIPITPLVSSILLNNDSEYINIY